MLLNGNMSKWIETHIGQWFQDDGMFCEFGEVDPKFIVTKFKRVEKALNKAIGFHHSPDVRGE